MLLEVAATQSSLEPTFVPKSKYLANVSTTLASVLAQNVKHMPVPPYVCGAKLAYCESTPFNTRPAGVTEAPLLSVRFQPPTASVVLVMGQACAAAEPPAGGGLIGGDGGVGEGAGGGGGGRIAVEP